MSENLIESLEPLLAPPVTRRPAGISDRDDGGVDVAVCCVCHEEGDDA